MKPKIAITLCSDSGIGLEILEKSFESSLWQKCEPCIFTNLNLPDIDIQSHFVSGHDRLVIEDAAQSCLQKKNDALVTLPVTKKGLGGVGHTEILSSITDLKTTMFFKSPTLNVSLVTTHIPLSQVAQNVTIDKVITTIEQTWNALKLYFGILNPKIYVAGFDPHCGETGGLIEHEILTPALRYCVQKKDMDVRGPYPADSLFHRAHMENASAVIALYHDQGLIPLKTLHFFDSCGITLGLPFLRVSVDHGTAQDLVGKNIANPASLLYSLQTILEILENQGHEVQS
ncbi:MAG: 4-hydroxythreonine-4-phosphate dehydrogenase PdxA [Deltaproteobacteria bacterium]|nr:4-hydroxythreonine-4-phosphate dehydrogenase PdxA [Deltaproteobacteria bacterium]